MATAPQIWLLTDNKPGHRNQLRGLGHCLRTRTGASLTWIDATDTRVGLLRALFGRSPELAGAPPAPDLIVAAGSGTHRLLLALRRRAPTVVLMKPAFPRALVDAIVAPAHDRLSENNKTLQTEGALNPMVPLAQLTRQRRGLILVGGPSPHCQWSDDRVMTQIRTLISQSPGWQWTVTNSRRTPARLNDTLADLADARVSVMGHNRTHQDWLAHQLASSRLAWVTPDSNSMVSEAITAGVPTALLDLPFNRGSRVADGVTRLQQRGLCYSFEQGLDLLGQDAPPPQPQLWEADRVARWLIERKLVEARP